MRRLAAPLVNGALLAISILTLLPLVWMLSVSLMSPGEASTFPPPLWPSRATLANYRELFAQAGLGRYLFNSVVLTAAVTLGSLLFNVAAGYAFAKLRFAGRDRIFKLLLGALVIPSQVAMVPLFLLLRNLGLVNTYGGIIVPALASIFGIFLVRQYALDDSRRHAGGGAHRRRERVPHLSLDRRSRAEVRSSSPSRCSRRLAAWNDFMWPLIVLNDMDLYTLPVALASLSREHVQDNELMMAGAVLTTFPVLLVFLALQRYYIRRAHAR